MTGSRAAPNEPESGLVESPGMKKNPFKIGGNSSPILLFLRFLLSWRPDGNCWVEQGVDCGLGFVDPERLIGLAITADERFETPQPQNKGVEPQRCDKLLSHDDDARQVAG